MGQFMGVLKKRFTLVSLVGNINTDYVIPQYHLVFYDLFQTLFRYKINKSVQDTIFMGFYSDNDWYVEQELTAESECFYLPLYLYEVWFS